MSDITLSCMFMLAVIMSACHAALLDLPATQKLAEHAEQKFELRLGKIANTKPVVWSCYPNNAVCIQVGGVSNAGAFAYYKYETTLKAKRSWCNRKFTYKIGTAADATSYSSLLDVTFTPAKPVIKHAMYDADKECLAVELEPEDAGD